MGRPPGFAVAEGPAFAVREASRIAVRRFLVTFARAFSPLIRDIGCSFLFRGQGAGRGAQMVFSRWHMPQQDHHLRPAPCALPPPFSRSDIDRTTLSLLA